MLVPPGAEPNTATWTPNVAQAGQYQVYARWTQHANRATNATYSVTHGSGSSAVSVNQQQGGGAWNLLGTFSLTPGTAHKIALNDQANGFVIADAIRLIPIAIQTEPRLYFIHVDHLNTPRAVYDAAQQLRWKWEQAEPFGVTPPDENPSTLGAYEFNLRFPGQYFDRETNLHYNYFRDYDPVLGRYEESDPIGLRGGLNTYVYVNAIPLRNVDPSGLDLIDTIKEKLFGKSLENGLSQSIGAKTGKKCADNISCPLYRDRNIPVFIHDQCKDMILQGKEGQQYFECKEKCEFF